jgi:hypothetical protein
MSRRDRCYATVRFAKFAAANAALECYQEDPPHLHGLLVTVVNNPADLPDCGAVMRRVLKPKTPKTPGKYVNVPKCSLDGSLTIVSKANYCRENGSGD